MRNIAIYGMAAFGQYIHKKVSEMKDVSVVCFIDNYKEKSINELPVYTLENYNENLFVDEIWVANSNYYALGHMIMSLHEKGFDKVTIIKPELWDKFSSGQEVSDIYEYVEGIIEEFHTGLTTEKSHDVSISATHCMGSDCHYFRDGKISKCALPLLTSYINDYFDLNFQVSADDYIDIYDENISPWEVVQKLDTATPFCDYCMEEGTVRFQWSNSGDISRADYFVINQKDKMIDGTF